MTTPHEEPISEQFHFSLDDEAVENIPDQVNFTIKVYLYGEASPADIYQFKD